MKKILKVLGVIILVIFFSMLVLPFVFRGKITNLLKVQGNEMIKGEFDFSSLDISLFKHFPKATISLNDFWLHGEGAFAKDTLAKSDELSVTVDLKSLMSDKYDVDHIYLSNSIFKAVVAKDGTPNWDIIKEDSSNAVETDTSIVDFNIDLKKVTIENLSVFYDDRQSGSLQSYTGINMDLSGQLQNDRYELSNSTIEMMNIKALVNGWVSLLDGKDMDFDIDIKTSKTSLSVPDMPKIYIEPSHLHLTSALLTLYSTKINIANSDMTLDCKVENLMNFLSDKGILSGKMNFSSNLIDLNDFMSHTDVPESNSTDKTPAIAASTVSESAIEVPPNINFIIDAKIKKLKMDDILLQSMKGQLLVKNQILTMNNLFFDVMRGSGKVNGSYNTQNIKQPKVDTKLSMKNISFAQAYKESAIVKKLVPIFSHAKGTFSVDMTLGMILDNKMNPVMNTIQGEGSLLTDSLLVTDVKVLKTLALVAKKPELSKIETKNLDIDFFIKDGLVTTSPFDVNIGHYKMTMSGKTGLDQSIDYDAKIDLPKGEKIAGMSNINFKIGGTFSKPKVNISTGNILKQLIKKDFILGNDSSSTTNKIINKGKSLLKKLHF